MLLDQMIELLEIAPGLWVRPNEVAAIRTTRPYSQGNVNLPATVTVYLISGKEVIGWELDSWDEARIWADRIAMAVNRAHRSADTAHQDRAPATPCR